MPVTVTITVNSMKEPTGIGFNRLKISFNQQKSAILIESNWKPTSITSPVTGNMLISGLQFSPLQYLFRYLQLHVNYNVYILFWNLSRFGI